MTFEFAADITTFLGWCWNKSGDEYILQIPYIECEHKSVFY